MSNSDEGESPKSQANADVLARLGAIPTDLDPINLAQELSRIVDGLAELPEVEASAILETRVFEQFELPNTVRTSLRRQLRQSRSSSKSRESFSRPDLYRELEQDQSTVFINPAQDFKNGVMYMAVKVAGKPYLLTSTRELLPLSELKSGPLRVLHDRITLTNMSPAAIRKYLKGEYHVRLPELFERITSYVRRFIVFKDDRWYAFIASWVIGTYFHRIFGYYPYVWLNAEKASGKTLTMKVIAPICFNGRLWVQPTAAVVFRQVAYDSMTLFIDEVEKLRKQDTETHEALMAVLNTGFERGAEVPRMEKGPNQVLETHFYPTYSPKMFAGINELHDVLMDRTIRLPLPRKMDSEAVERFRQTDETAEFQQGIKDDLCVFALDVGPSMADRYNQNPPDVEGTEGLPDRERDIWEPIFVVANEVDQARGSTEVTEGMRFLSQQSMIEKQETNTEQNLTYRLLTFMRELLTELSPIEDGNGRWTVEADTVLKAFKDSGEFPYTDTPYKLTRELKKIEFKSERKHHTYGKRHVYSFSWEKFQEWCTRYRIEPAEKNTRPSGQTDLTIL